MTETTDKRSPTITDLISLPVPSAGRVSPDGRFVSYLVSNANWKDNRHESRCFVHDRERGTTHALTRTGHASEPRWLDERSLAVLKLDLDAPGDDSGAQIWLFEGLVGEGWQVTEHDGGVSAFEPFADGFVYKAPHPERRKRKERKEQFGNFVYQEREDSADALYYISLPRLREHLDAVRACSGEAEREKLRRPVVELSAILPEPLTIIGFSASPAGDAIFLKCRERDDLVYLDDMRCYRIRLDPETALTEHLKIEAEKAAKNGDGAEAKSPADGDQPGDVAHLGELTRLALPAAAILGPLSPEGDRIVVRHRVRDSKWYTQTDLFTLDVTGSKAELESDDLTEHWTIVTRDWDHDPLMIHWVDAGILVSVVSGTDSEIYLLGNDEDPLALALGDARPSPMFEVTPTGHLCFVGAGADRVSEVYAAHLASGGAVHDLARLTDLGAATAEYALGTVETIRWKSRDGTEVEGVLRKPPGFEGGRRYPLVFVVHGGPSWASRELLLDGEDLRYYPAVELAQRGVLVLKPNYRGSIGRGQDFLELNARNLGVGDLWDLESAIDALVEQGMVDPDRVGCMGWSQGGYISAMAATHSDRFKAVSVGAGISDWYTYHVSNDIPQFTTHYLDASPFDDREIYRLTAPIEGLSEDTAPMLIQHGVGDQRVPFSNAMELFRGLQDKGVQVELFAYPEMGHPITKPRENRAVMWQNLTWFSHHLLGEPLEFFESPEPKEAE